MTILEVVVAIALLTSAIFAGVSTFDAVSHSTVTLAHRTRAVEIAEREIETMRSVAYIRIGLSPSDPAFVATFEKASTVRVENPVIDAESVVSQAGKDYAIERHVTWVDVTTTDGGSSDSTLTLGAYKRLTVIVRWKDATVGTVRLDSGVSPFSQPQACNRRDVDGSPGRVDGVVDRFYAGLSDAAAGASVLAIQDVGRGNTSQVALGDLVLVIQMSGPDAGRYEYARAASGLANDRLAVTGQGKSGGLVNSYSAADHFQVLRVPTYASTVIGSPTTLPWDGTTGGVLAFDVAGVATFDGTVNASGMGFDDSGPAMLSPSAERLTPASGDTAGGGLVMIRASSVSGVGAVTSDGGGGGTVVVAVETGGLDGLTIDARGDGAGVGGTALVSAPTGSIDLSAKSGAGGVATTDLDLRDLVGSPLGVGCQPALASSVTSTYPDVVNDGTGTADYVIAVTSAPDHSTATGVTITDSLPSGFTYLSTSAIDVTGGTMQDATSDPTVGEVAPRWGSFTVPAGGGLTIRFTAAVSPQVAPGVVGNNARVNYASPTGASVGAYDESMSTSDDLVVKPFACPVPSTDVAPRGGLVGIVNTYYPATADAAAGATSVRVGAPVGSPSTIAAGDMLLLVQVQAATIDTSDSPRYGDGPGGAAFSGATAMNHAGDYEYAVATGPVTDGRVSLVGSGIAGGLIHSYQSQGATPAAGPRTFEIVRVPSYPDTSLVKLEALPWNGSAGGVLAVDVTGNLDLANGSASASGAGFRGGAAVARSSRGNAVRDDTGVAGGSKGEGVAGTPQSLFVDGTLADGGVDAVPGGGSGYGAPANGGGGGGVSAGGGGGSNGGPGGNGGRSNENLAGRGGTLPALSSSAATFGGGGGSTQLDVGQTITNPAGGGRGGGAVFLRSTTISGSGNITADGIAGSAGETGSGTESGGSGGGAGGTVVISTTTPSLTALTVDARGGTGGDVADPNATVAAGGGGGGGGRILSTAELSTVVNGGAGGVPSGGGNASGAPGSSDGRDGRTTRVSNSEVTGQLLGQGCRPILVVTTHTTTPSLLRVGGDTAQWIINVSNLAGHVDALGIGITDLLPPGFTLASTDAITLDGGAARSTVADPTPGAAVPTWGAFDLPGGGSVSITFSAAHTGASSGTIGNSAQAGASYFGSTIVSRYADADGTTDDVTLVDPTTTVFAHTMVDQLTTPSPITTVDPLWAVDGTTFTTGAFPSVLDASRHLDIDFTTPALPPTSRVLQPQPNPITLTLDFAAASPGTTACLAAQLGTASSGATPTSLSSPQCVTGTTLTPTTITLPPLGYTGAALGDLRVRLIGTSTDGTGIVIDQVAMAVAWQGTTFHLQPTTWTDSSSGWPAPTQTARAMSGDASAFVTAVSAAIGSSYSSSNFVDLRLPAQLPPDASVGSVSGSFRWNTDAPATTCWYLDLRIGGSRVGGVGSPGSSICHGGSDQASTDVITLPKLTASQLNDLTARVYFRTSWGSAASISVDQFSLDVTWSRP